MNLLDEISAVAYELFESRGCIHGCDFDDWLKAESIVLARHAGQEMEEPEDVDMADEIADMEKERLEEAAVVKRHKR